MLGRPAAKKDESEMTAASAASSSARAITNDSRSGEPISSSPSTKILRLTGRPPPACCQASMAIRCAKNCPLSSQAPRAYTYPSRTSGSNGSDCHFSSGSGG